MIKPFHGDMKNLAGLSRSRRPLVDHVRLSQGRSYVARVISEWAAGADLGHVHGCDVSLCERSCHPLQALISTCLMGCMPCTSARPVTG